MSDDKDLRKGCWCYDAPKPCGYHEGQLDGLDLGHMALEPEITALRSRIQQLEAWKTEALTVLGDWDEVWEALGRPGPLGSSKAASSLAWLGGDTKHE